MARDPLVVEILTELREQRPIITQLQVSVATMAQTILGLQNLPGRVEQLEKDSLKARSFVEGGLWVWTKLVGIVSIVVSGIMFVAKWLHLLPQ